MKKKVWEKPRLVVLFRGRPEEYVLVACKTHLVQGPAVNPCTKPSNIQCGTAIGT